MVVVLGLPDVVVTVVAFLLLFSDCSREDAAANDIIVNRISSDCVGLRLRSVQGRLGRETGWCCAVDVR